MAFTAGDLIEDVLSEMQGSLDEEQVTQLVGSIGPTDLSFNVSTARGVALGISPGVVEIDQELLYVSTVSGTTATVAFRGFKRTTAASHSDGARVTSQPQFSRAKVLDAINQACQRVYPMVFAVRNYESTTTVPVITYDLPDDAVRVVKAAWQLPDGTKRWVSVDRWKMSQGGGTQFGDGLNGITVDVADVLPAGRPIQFLYAARPTALAAETDVFTTTTGLPASMRDVIKLGAVVDLLPSQELSRLQQSSVEQQNRSQLVAPSAALTSSRYLEQKFQQRLAEERRALLELYPPRITGSWK